MEKHDKDGAEGDAMRVDSPVETCDSRNHGQTADKATLQNTKPAHESNLPTNLDAIPDSGLPHDASGSSVVQPEATIATIRKDDVSASHGQAELLLHGKDGEPTKISVGELMTGWSSAEDEMSDDQPEYEDSEPDRHYHYKSLHGHKADGILHRTGLHSHVQKGHGHGHSRISALGAAFHRKSASQTPNPARDSDADEHQGELGGRGSGVRKLQNIVPDSESDGMESEDLQDIINWIRTKPSEPEQRHRRGRERTRRRREAHLV